MSDAEWAQYHLLPIDDPLRSVNLLRQAAGLGRLAPIDDLSTPTTFSEPHAERT